MSEKHAKPAAELPGVSQPHPGSQRCISGRVGAAPLLFSLVCYLCLPCSATGLCKPVCEQGCVNGTCVEPNACQCHFGYVGQNCSVECHCNKHSNCRGVGAQDQCLQCFNNTMVSTASDPGRIGPGGGGGENTGVFATSCG